MSLISQSDVPENRLTRIADIMTKAMDAYSETQAGDRAIVFINDGDSGGIVIHRYERPNEAVADIVVHLQAMFESQGKVLELIMVPESPEGAEDE